MPPALIAGGGIAGLTTALAFAKVGLQSNVLERAAHFSEFGAGLQISPNAASVLVDLGLGEALDAADHKPDFIRMRAAKSGRLVKRLAINAHCQSRFDHPYRVVHRADLLNILVQAASANPLISLHNSADVTAVTDAPDGLGVATADGRSFTGSVLVAADGVWSTIRTRALGLAPAQPTGRSAWRALVPAEPDGNSENYDVGLWMGPGAHLVHYPVRDGSMINLVAVVDDGFAEPTWDGETGSGDLQRHFRTWCDKARMMIGKKPVAGHPWRRWPLFQLRPDRYTVDRPIALVGDAWHATLPFMAQGAAMAIEDAAILAHCLRLASDPIAAVRHFQEDRLVRTTRLVDLASRNGTLYHLAGPMAFARDSVLAGLPSASLLSRLDWIYGWKPPTLA